jgi:GrpB-like predicted nucleotidyltransferase (UPF0157 family)
MNIDFKKYNIGMKKDGSVELAAPDAGWPECFEKIAAQLQQAVGDTVSLHHIGSTSIPGIKAKPIIDILGVADDIKAFEAKKPELEKLGFHWKGEFGIEGRAYCVLYSDATHAESLVHFHTFQKGAHRVERHFAFRDFMRTFPEKAKEYEARKIELGHLYCHDRKQYSDAKEEFIEKVMKEALAWKRNTTQQPPQFKL